MTSLYDADDVMIYSFAAVIMALSSSLIDCMQFPHAPVLKQGTASGITSAKVFKNGWKQKNSM